MGRIHGQDSVAVLEREDLPPLPDPTPVDKDAEPEGPPPAPNRLPLGEDDISF